MRYLVDPQLIERPGSHQLSVPPAPEANKVRTCILGCPNRQSVSLPDRPVIHDQFLHRKVARIACGQASPHTSCRSRHQAIGLAERDAARGKLTPPPTSLLAL
jgi:hypothetical protein